MRAPHSTDRGIARTPALVKTLLILAIVGVLAFDAASVFRATVVVTDLSADAARAGVNAVAGMPVNGTSARIAYEAANETAEATGAVVALDGFVLTQDRKIRLTVKMDAPTVVLKFIPGLRNWTHVEEASTQEFFL